MTVRYLYLWDIDLAPFNDTPIVIWNSYDSMVFFCFSFYYYRGTELIPHKMIGCFLIIMWENFSAISWWQQIMFQRDDDDVRFVLDRHVELDVHSASWLQQQSIDSHVYALGELILIQYLMLPLIVTCLADRDEMQFLRFDSRGFEPTMYHTQDENANYYTIDAVSSQRSIWTQDKHENKEHQTVNRN